MCLIASIQKETFILILQVPNHCYSVICNFSGSGQPSALAQGFGINLTHTFLIAGEIGRPRRNPRRHGGTCKVQTGPTNLLGSSRLLPSIHLSIDPSIRGERPWMIKGGPHLDGGLAWDPPRPPSSPHTIVIYPHMSFMLFRELRSFIWYWHKSLYILYKFDISASTPVYYCNLETCLWGIKAVKAL